MCMYRLNYCRYIMCVYCYLSNIQLMSQIVGVFHEPATGLVCLFKEDMLSFLYPATSFDCLALQIPGIYRRSGKFRH